MAHQIATNRGNGRAAMAYVGEPPWHHLGTRVEEAMTAREAIDAAGLGYEVESLPVYAQRRDGTGSPSGPEIAIPSHFLNVRTDDWTPLGVVSDKYKVIQNRECFGFLDAVVADGGMRYETAGALGRGERVWMLARVPGDLHVKGTDDAIRKYLLLYNAHDASTALRVLWSPTRVVCWNTCSAALRAGEGTGISIQHTGEIVEKVAEAQRTLGLAVRYYDDLQARIDFLASASPTRQQLEGYFRALYPDPKDRDPAGAKATRMTLFGLFEQGMGQDMPGIKGTTWAAYNAVTEFVDHHRPSRVRDTELAQQRRLVDSWMGDGARSKVRAFDLAMQLAERPGSFDQAVVLAN